MQMQSSVLKIMRKNNGFVDLLRSYEIILDGKNVGIVFPNQTTSVVVEPGHHSLKMKIDWFGSEEINFNIGSGEDITFECEPRHPIVGALLMPYHLMFEPNNWILLKRC
jgi:hypothetical protein